jgi:phosphate transport system protein
MSNHIMHAFDNDLKMLEGKIMQMGEMTKTAIDLSIKALMTHDIELAKTVRAGDKAIDALQRDIEEKGTLTIAKRQPMANDLRAIVGTFRVANDLERMVDLAKNIAKRVMTIDLSESQLKKAPMAFDTLSRLANERLDSVLKAYAAGDTEGAKTIWGSDDEIDAGYNSLFRELLTYMVESPKNISACAHLLFCAKNIERMGDHATNIAETVWYVAKGEILGDDRPRG